MRLKKLILQGFKSFADRTEFVFDSPITGIVGPNGCGKSNVVDGFKWVLGELFFDTGIGVDAYSVIEQGRVSALLEANPEERRLIFEEAAGISKFKAKKKEAQRKLERVDQNLLRVTDIVEEVEKRLRSVRIQAGRARMFKEHSDRLRELRLTYALQEYHTHHLQLEEQVSQQGQSQAELEQVATDLSEK